MFDEILRAIEDARGPITVKELADRLGYQESALEKMLEYLERKGRLSIYRPGRCDEGMVDACVRCVFGRGCPDAKRRG